MLPHYFCYIIPSLVALTFTVQIFWKDFWWPSEPAKPVGQEEEEKGPEQQVEGLRGWGGGGGAPGPCGESTAGQQQQEEKEESTNINLYPDDCWTCRALHHL